MEKRVFTHVVANVIIVALIIIVATVGFAGTTANVFNTTDNAPIYRGTGVKQVSLMINVYWGTEYLDGMLSIFSKYGVCTTFFVGGAWVAQYPYKLQQIIGCGHEIGNHGYSHKQHGSLDYAENVKEIDACGKMVFEYTGYVMRLFAPPSGDFNKETLNAASDCGYKTIMWSRDTIDWRDKDAQKVYSRATKSTSDGELILLHPTKHTLSVLENIVKYYIDNGYQIVPVSTNIGEICNSSNNTQAD